MPHIPRRTASTTSPSPELTTIPRRPSRPSRPPVPYQGSFEQEEPFRASPRNPFVERQSIRSYQGLDTETLVKALFGKEVKRDERTGELVPAE